MSETISLMASRELAKRLKPLGLTPAAFARLPDAPRPVLRIGMRSLRWARDAVDFWIGQHLEAARREAEAQGMQDSLS